MGELMSGLYIPDHAKIGNLVIDYLTLKVGRQVIPERNTCERKIRAGNNPPRRNNSVAVSIHISRETVVCRYEVS